MTRALWLVISFCCYNRSFQGYPLGSTKYTFVLSEKSYFATLKCSVEDGHLSLPYSIKSLDFFQCIILTAHLTKVLGDQIYHITQTLSRVSTSPMTYI